MRKIANDVSQYWLFEWTIIFLILLSTLTLALEEPFEDPESTKMRVILVLDYIMTIIFTLEALLKIIAVGLIFNKKTSYLRSPWNVLDFGIVVSAIISLASDADI